MTAMTATRLVYANARPSRIDRLIIRAGLVLLAWGRRRAARPSRPDFAGQQARVEASREEMLRRFGSWMR